MSTKQFLSKKQNQKMDKYGVIIQQKNSTKQKNIEKGYYTQQEANNLAKNQSKTKKYLKKLLHNRKQIQYKLNSIQMNQNMKIELKKKKREQQQIFYNVLLVKTTLEENSDKNQKHAQQISCNIILDMQRMQIHKFFWLINGW
eukprot:TRINITY_DN7113_c0_g1_i2.p8 TRINITY_DN7113_c0_g1~~TRINITY_DN7113_c0_g1_i2.p8  ORF type:complete len:143 (+),score=4.74 TRINITY_DN7113_c0_g1_i2:1177-1605(+)